MADSISQADLDALWGSLSENQTTEPPSAKKEEPAQPAGISQADLDALWGQPGDAGKPAETAPAADEPGGLSQADLDALWGAAGLAPPEPSPPPAAPKQEPASSGGENLSQEDIDKLLAEMGR